MERQFYFKEKKTGRRLMAVGYSPKNALLRLGYDILDFILVGYETTSGEIRRYE